MTTRVREEMFQMDIGEYFQHFFSHSFIENLMFILFLYYAFCDKQDTSVLLTVTTEETESQ